MRRSYEHEQQQFSWKDFWAKVLVWYVLLKYLPIIIIGTGLSIKGVQLIHYNSLVDRCSAEFRLAGAGREYSSQMCMNLVKAGVWTWK